MICTNTPCKNLTTPTSGDLHLCPTCFQAWQNGLHHWSQTALATTAYHTRASLLIRLPKPFDETLFPDGTSPDLGLPLPWLLENTRPFKDLFDPLPPHLPSCGFLELGAWQGTAYESEFSVPFFLGPDGQVWAEVGDLADLPNASAAARDALAAQMLEEFREAAQGWLADGCPHPITEAEFRTWPVPRVMHWLQTCLPQTDALHTRLITGLLAELRALGFQPKP
ncbi:MAG: hypothetical protein HUU38_03110 [Anaerolineales bacterium]|nr:hypothetical protein [Anaerolineales bacterium]